MEPRAQKLLAAIVAEHVKTAGPVGSAVVAERYDLEVSPATIRNDMVMLEEAGYITHPHTSAGRIPTELGYRYYVANLALPRAPKDSARHSLDRAARTSEPETKLKALAKELAELSAQSVFVGFRPLDAYYTGLANLFRQPEFAHQALVTDVSAVVDHLDEVVAKLFRSVTAESVVLIGSDSPFGNACASIVARYQHGPSRGIFGLFGPMRMDYDQTLGLVQYVQTLIHHS